MRRARLGLILAAWGLIVGVWLGVAAGREVGERLTGAERAQNVKAFETAERSEEEQAAATAQPRK